MRVLVTGASGFVGSTLCDELCRAGHEVTVLVRKTSSRGNLFNSGQVIRYVEGDLREAKSLGPAVVDAEVIFHVAGVVSAVWESEFFDANAKGTENLAQAVRGHAKNLKRFVYVSSLAAGGPSEPGKERLETDDPQPTSAYGLSKLAGEIALRKYAKEIPSVIVRPPVVYGPRDKGVLAFFQAIASGVRPELGWREETRRGRRYSFVHVEDLVQGIMAAGLRDFDFAPTEVFYVCGDGAYTWSETMDMVEAAWAQASGKKKKLWTVPVPIPLVNALGVVGSGVSRVTGKVLPICIDKAKEITASGWVCSNAKAKRVLGLQPKWDVPSGFKHAAEWYKARGWL